jgi:hypothetical protein
MATPSKEVELPRTDIKNQQGITKIISEFLCGLEEEKIFSISLKEFSKSKAFPEEPTIVSRTKQVVIKRKGDNIQIYCFIELPPQYGASAISFINTDLSLLIAEIARGDGDLTTLRKIPDEKHLSLLSLYWMLRDAIVEPAKLELQLCSW